MFDRSKVSMISLAFLFAFGRCDLPEAKQGEILITEDGGVSKTILKEGKGKIPTTGQKVRVHYTGTLTTGKKFDSSYDRNQPFEFTIGSGVIEGWSIGVATMKVGERAKFALKSQYGYGKHGAGGLIPPNADLYFEIELLQILQ